MGAVLLVALGIGAGLLIAGGDDDGGGTTQAAATESETTSTTSTTDSFLEDVAEDCDGNVVNGVCESDPDPAEADGTFRIPSCDLGSGNELIGSVRVRNVGSVALVAEVPFSWRSATAAFSRRRPSG